jgi:hypothetical protein
MWTRKKTTGKGITKMSGEHEELKDILKYLWPACRCIVTKNLTAESQKRTAPTEDAPPKPPVFLFLVDSRALELSGSQALRLSGSQALVLQLALRLSLSSAVVSTTPRKQAQLGTLIDR